MLVIKAVANVFGVQEIFAETITFSDMVFGPASIEMLLEPAFIKVLIPEQP